MGFFTDKLKKNPGRESHELMVKRLSKLHPGETPKTIEAIIERIRQIDADINAKTAAEKINER